MATFPSKRNQSEVIRAFLDGSSGQTSNLLTDGTTIWSYGDHWPLAIKTGERDVLVNVERYSMTTSHHRTAVTCSLVRHGYALQDATLAEMRRLRSE